MDFARVERDGPVARLVLHNPPGNRINVPMRQEIRQAIAFVARSDARALLVTGSGDDFCLGGDIRDWIGVPSAELRPKIEVLAHAIDALESLPIPTIAVVQGGCVGGGFELALGCDFIVAASQARFVFPESRLGIMTLQGGVYQLAERIGRSKALELAMLATPIEAAQMAAWNVVNRVVEARELDAAATALAARLIDHPTDVYARTKTLLKAWQDQGRPAARAALYDLSMPLFDSPAVQRALRDAAASMLVGAPGLKRDHA